MTTYVAHLGNVRTSGLRSALLALLAPVRAWHRRRRALAELRALPPYLLADIGIDRDEIHAAVEGLLKRG